MKRRLNFTNRKNLTAEHVSFFLEDCPLRGKDGRFSANFSIPPEWRILPTAKVYVEAYVATTSMRFDFGIAAKITAPGSTSLSEIDLGSPLFRVKIVDESGDIGLILASAVEIRPENAEDENEGNRSFFPLAMRDLGDALWRVEFSRSERPVLQLNNRIPGLREQLLTSPILQGAILPAAMRIVLSSVLIRPEYAESDWLDDWKAFVNELGGEPWPDEDEQDDDDYNQLVVDSAIGKFEELKKFVIRAKDSLIGGNDD